MKQSLGLLFVVTTVAASCDFPPSLWCSSSETAKLCKVEDQCRVYIESPAGPVNLALYYESECNACRAFISNQLYKVWRQLGSSVLNVTLVPYGNAKEKKHFGKWEFTCQHGQEECVGNLIEVCSMTLMKNFTDYFSFIYCIESQQWTPPAEAAQHCAKKMKIDMSAINQCANSDQGKELLHQMALVTATLNPPHTYVPWLTFYGQHDKTLESKALVDLLPVVCDLYKGPKPTACTTSENTHRCYKTL